MAKKHGRPASTHPPKERHLIHPATDASIIRRAMSNTSYEKAFHRQPDRARPPEKSGQGNKDGGAIPLIPARIVTLRCAA
jgi:hypothetical protein